MVQRHSAGAGVTVRGLRDLQKALRELDKTYPRELRVVNKDAAEIVASGARSKAQSLGGVHAKSAPSIKAAAQQRQAGVSIGGPRWPYAIGAEFGGGKYGKGNPTPGGGYTTQFPPWRGRGTGAGYFLFPTIRRDIPRIEEHYERALDALARKHFDQ